MNNNNLIWTKCYKGYAIYLRKVNNGFRLIIYQIKTLSRYKITLDPSNYEGKEEIVAHEFIDGLPT